MPSSKPFTFICGQDDYLVARVGQERFAAMAADAADEFSREIVDGTTGNVDAVEIVVRRMREAVGTLPLFGGRRAVWLKDATFLADTVTGRAESTLKLVEDLQEILAAVDPATHAVLVTAAPVDRRRSFLKWCEKNADFVRVGGDEDGDGDAARQAALAEARALGAAFEPEALELLLARIGPNPRLLVEETRKLASHAGAEGAATIAEAAVAELTPNVAEGDFFETAEAFFSGDLAWTLQALRRHWFGGGDARPVLAALQNRNRLLLQIRALLDAGQIRLGPRGIDGLPRAAAAHAEKFGSAAAEKTSFNLFAQNPWYLGKLAGGCKLPSLRRLIDRQQAFVVAFREILDRPREQEEVLRDMAVRCLAEV